MTCHVTDSPSNTNSSAPHDIHFGILTISHPDRHTLPQIVFAMDSHHTKSKDHEVMQYTIPTAGDGSSDLSHCHSSGAVLFRDGLRLILDWCWLDEAVRAGQTCKDWNSAWLSSRPRNLTYAFRPNVPLARLTSIPLPMTISHHLTNVYLTGDITPILFFHLIRSLPRVQSFRCTISDQPYQGMIAPITSNSENEFDRALFASPLFFHSTQLTSFSISILTVNDRRRSFAVAGQRIIDELARVPPPLVSLTLQFTIFEVQNFAPLTALASTLTDLTILHSRTGSVHETMEPIFSAVPLRSLRYPFGLGNLNMLDPLSPSLTHLSLRPWGPTFNLITNLYERLPNLTHCTPFKGFGGTRSVDGKFPNKQFRSIELSEQQIDIEMRDSVWSFLLSQHELTHLEIRYVVWPSESEFTQFLSQTPTLTSLNLSIWSVETIQFLTVESLISIREIRLDCDIHFHEVQEFTHRWSHGHKLTLVGSFVDWPTQEISRFFSDSSVIPELEELHIVRYSDYRTDLSDFHWIKHIRSIKQPTPYRLNKVLPG